MYPISNSNSESLTNILLLLLLHISPLCITVLLLLFFFSSSSSSSMLGLACIFRDLTMSKQSKAKDKLKEMEVSEEQWEQFKKLTKSGSDNPLENDTNDMVMNRVQKGKEEERKKKKKTFF